MPSGRRGRVKAGTSILDAARQLGVEIESICGGRLTCAKCKVHIEQGHFPKHAITSNPNNLSAMEEEEKALLAETKDGDHRLSCVTHVFDDILVFVPEESRANKQIIRKSATVRAIDIAPTIQQLYVEVEEAELGHHLGDWGRLQDALADEWQLQNLTIDLHALRRLQAVLREGKWSVTAVVRSGSEVLEVLPGYQEGIYGLAVDIGSTTVAAYLCDLRTGDIMAADSMMNPQVIYGEDLMSRISYAMDNRDGLDKMHQAIIDALNKLIGSVVRKAGLRRYQIYEGVFVGNTTMTHIFLGISPVEIGTAPFALANRDAHDIKARELGLRLHPSAYVHVLPSEAGHVGADNVGVLIAEEPYEQDETTLIVDVGTNAEILLGNRDWLYSASSPTGPAFEGAQISFGMRAAPGAIERVRIDRNTYKARFQVIGEEKWSDQWPRGADVPPDLQPAHLAAGICGSGIIEAVAEMYLSGIIYPDGRFNPDCEGEYFHWEDRSGAYVLASADQTTTGERILVTQSDIRNIQLAKAALYAGARLLMIRAGVDAIDRIALAGAFGSYIDPKYALILGLIPDCQIENISAVGNAAGDGARIALLNRRKRREAQEISRRTQYIETAVDPDFQKEFVDALHIPHMNDKFPNLKQLLIEVANDDMKPGSQIQFEKQRGRPRRHQRKK
jgi:uncharacterized 2Fe-2S/4Fe-4S cluster protein (DUF4445 family)